VTKTAIFVEGQTELIFVRELLLKVFDYQNIWLECYTLFTDSKFHSTEYAYPNPSANSYFQIINVGSDANVLTRMLRRKEYMLNAGFSKIIGLRDMYSLEYRKQSGGKIDPAVTDKFKKGYSAQIKSPELMHFCFAIMEVEAWILGFDGCFEKIDDGLTQEYILHQLNHALNKLDPETHFFHPAEIIENLFALVGKNYSKSKGDVNQILGVITKEDFMQLYKANKCASFTQFCDCLPLPQWVN